MHSRMWLTVRRVVEAASIYPDRADVFRSYPELEPEDLRQALAFAAANFEDSGSGNSGRLVPLVFLLDQGLPRDGSGVTIQRFRFHVRQ